MKNLKLKHIMLIILYTTILIFFFIHMKDVISALGTVFRVIAPVLYGLVIAYLMNSPYKLFRDHAFKKMGAKHKWLQRLRKPLALVLSYVIVIGIVAFLIGTLIPELSSSVSTLIDNIPAYKEAAIDALDKVVVFVHDTTGYNLYDQVTYNSLVSLITGNDIPKFIGNIFTNVFPSAWTTIVGIGSGLYNWGLGLIISIYLLVGKEKLLRQFRLAIIAYTPEKFHSRFFKVADVFNNKCGKFIVGKIIDSSIIGVMCFIGMSIFRFHYPLLISCIIGVFNLIPFFGPIIGAIPTIILLLIIDPWEALGFAVFLIVLQQIDGNFLGPKILGESVGISGFWIMISVIVGGGLFGVPGMLLGVPVFAAIYTLVDAGVMRRLKKKQISADDVAPPVEEDPPKPPRKGLKDNPLVEKASELINKGKKSK